MPDTDLYSPRDTLFLWWLGTPDNPRLIGELTLVAGGRAVGLRYDASWLHGGFPLSEDLPLKPGLVVPAEKDAAAGAVDDARPDRWGERVIRKFERSPRLSILEYLYFAGDDRHGALGVGARSDVYRPWRHTTLPHLGQLADIEAVVRQVLSNEAVPDRHRGLIQPGVSLGGARPKSVIEIDCQPWLVKFSEGEDMDTELIEHATMTLAVRCGIDTAETRALPLSRQHALAVRRFDRVDGRRLHALSARVVLRAAGEPFGYPQLAQQLRRLAPAALIAREQQQLFRRMVFNILVDNTDDHEQNHALLRQADGSFRLSPAFDVVPSAQGLGYQAMAVGAAGSESSLENALSQSHAFGLRAKDADTIVSEVATVVNGWSSHFRSLGVPEPDVEVLAQYLETGRLGQERRSFQARPVRPPASPRRR